MTKKFKDRILAWWNDENTLLFNVSDTSINGSGYFGMRSYGHYWREEWLHEVRVRKYTSPEPTVTIENVSESWLTLSTDKKNYTLGEKNLGTDYLYISKL